MTRRSLYFQPEIRPPRIRFSKRQGTEHLRRAIFFNKGGQEIAIVLMYEGGW
jgi:hypothetical protein